MTATKLFDSSHRIGLLTLCLAALVTLSACKGDVRAPGDTDPINSPTQTPGSNEPVNAGSGGTSVDNGQFRIELSATRFNITEGGDTAGVSINVVRQNGHSAPIKLTLETDSVADAKNVSAQFSDDMLSTSETQSDLRLSVLVGRAPIQRQIRSFRIVANDSALPPLSAEVVVEVAPTPANDVYLLIGQSNMVGSSLPNARESDEGEPDAPNGRVFQLNVTGNDGTNFPNPAAFSNENSVANPDALIVTALDPLHDGFDFSINGKENTRIGLGLTFAKSMLPSTTANVILVPAAWSDTGFCKTETNIYPGAGWHASPPSDTTNFAGTLLHDRALTRLNLTLRETGGIFRGILWHQGEADSNSDACAARYEQNLKDLVASIRTNARVDARGPQARGSAADIPFIAGTMSRGAEFADLWPAKAIVDEVHRNVSGKVPFAASVIADDLVPNAFPCGEGGCIHFGSRAYREMGVRYAEQMRAVQNR